MKIFIVTLATIILTAGCQEYHLPSETMVSEQAVPQTVLTVFNNMYPAASNVDWDSKASYWVASFDDGVTVKSSGRQRNSAWFDNTGKWYMTEVPSALDMLPQAVRDAFQASEYASWRVDDVDIILRNGIATFYVIEVEGQRDGVYMDVELYYSEDGTLVMEEVDVDDDYSDCLPVLSASSVAEAVEALYPGARILDIEMERGIIEAEIVDADRVERDLYFTDANEWILTQTELRYAQLPQAVKDGFTSSQYSSVHVDDVDHFIFATGVEYYILEVESRQWDDLDLKVTPEGALTIATRQESDPI